MRVMVKSEMESVRKFEVPLLVDSGKTGGTRSKFLSWASSSVRGDSRTTSVVLAYESYNVNLGKQRNQREGWRMKLSVVVPFALCSWFSLLAQGQSSLQKQTATRPATPPAKGVPAPPPKAASLTTSFPTPFEELFRESLTLRAPVQRLSAEFLKKAQTADHPVVPSRFEEALPQATKLYKERASAQK